MSLSVLAGAVLLANNFLFFSGTTTILSAPGAGMVMNSVAKGFSLAVATSDFATSFLMVAVSIFKGFVSF